MKNIVISFILFILLFIAMVFSMNYLENKSYYYSEKAIALESSINENSWDEAYKKSSDLLKEWEKSASILPAFINHSYVENITSNILKLRQFIKVKDKVNALSAISEIKFYLNLMHNIEKVTLPNIL